MSKFGIFSEFCLCSALNLTSTYNKQSQHKYFQEKHTFSGQLPYFGATCWENAEIFISAEYRAHCQSRPSLPGMKISISTGSDALLPWRHTVWQVSHPPPGALTLTAWERSLHQQTITSKVPLTFTAEDENQDIYFDGHLVTSVIYSTTNATPTLRHLDTHSMRKTITSVNIAF